MLKTSYTYIMTNPGQNVLYVGVTDNLLKRAFQHKCGFYPNSFTSRYNCVCLVYYEQFYSIKKAIKREKQLKNWKRQWKLDLIKAYNPDFEDLYFEVKKFNLT